MWTNEEQISSILIDPKTGEEFIDVPPTVAAKYLGVALNFIYDGLQKQVLPIGVAVQSDRGRWTYNIPVDRLKAYKQGADMNITTSLLNNILPLLQQINRGP